MRLISTEPPLPNPVYLVQIGHNTTLVMCHMHANYEVANWYKSIKYSVMAIIVALTIYVQANLLAL